MEEMNGSKKMGKVKHADFTQIQPYMTGKSVHLTRICFKTRCEMVPDLKGNFKQKYRVGVAGDVRLKCNFCNLGEIENQTHCAKCPKWGKFKNRRRKKKD